MTGAVIASVSFFLSTFSPNLDVLIVTYGIMGGMGFGLMYLPAIVIVGFYFDKKRALATGLAVCGSGIGTMLFAPLGRLLLDTYGWKGSYMIISAIILNGVACGAIFRPLEAKKTSKKKLKKKEAEEIARVKSQVIMQKIIEEKKRQRTISSGSLDGCVITRDNTLVKDPDKIKQIKNMNRSIILEKLEEEHEEDFSSEPNINGTSMGNGTTSMVNGSMYPYSAPMENSPLADELQIDTRITESGRIYTASKNSESSSNRAINKHLLKVKGEGLSHRIRTISTDSSRSNGPIWQRFGHGVGSTRSLAEVQEEKKKDVARPMYRQDIFFTGSLSSLAEFKSTSDMESYVNSITSIPAPVDDDDTSCMAQCRPLCVVLKQMLDFSLLRSATFVLLCACSVLAMTGFFTPFVFITANAIKMGIDPRQATFLLSILGICNTFGRILCGWISDQSWADCLLIHNMALVIAGVATCCVPLLNSFPLLVIYCVIFGSCIAAFITLRSIVLVELLGLSKLANSFGILLLFQGCASIVGSPVAGMIYDATNSFTASFVSSGALIALAGLICLPVRRVAAWENSKNIIQNMDYKDIEHMGSDYMKIVEEQHETADETTVTTM
jgi:predicted MFS family arabinose efflux permease